MEIKLYLFDMSVLNDWLLEIDETRFATQLFEHIPNVMFFVKDRQFRIMTGNQAFAERCGCRSSAELFGKRDEQLFPPYMAEKFRRDDQEVLASGKPLLGLVELFPTREGLPEWFLTQKIPIYSRANEIHGIGGIVQNYERMLGPAKLPIFSVVEYIRENYQRRLSVPQLAQRVGLSQSQLERRFRETFRVSPRKFIVRLRVLVASERLRSTDTSITNIALDCGFYDHSSFIRHFKAVMGTTPLVYRKRGFVS